jgi:hypothetical protein
MSAEYRSLSEVMKTVMYVVFAECRDNCLWYDAMCADEKSARPDWTLRFRIPLEDVAGATFPAMDIQRIYYMRWIRKELLLYKEEQETIAKAKEDWEP